jgi:hypothetical protein
MYQAICTLSKTDTRSMFFEKDNLLHNFSLYMFDNIEKISINVEHIDEDLVQSYHFYIYLPTDKYANES